MSSQLFPIADCIL